MPELDRCQKALMESFLSDRDDPSKEGLDMVLFGDVIVLCVRCSSAPAAEQVRDSILGDLADFGKFTIAVGLLHHGSAS